MNKVLISLISLVAGGGIGFVTGAKFSKIKFEKIADEEIESVKSVYAKHFEKTENVSKAPEKKSKKEPVMMEKSKVAPTTYKDYTKPYKSEEGANDKNVRPYEISPDEFGNSDYDVRNLYYFADKILTDDNFNRIVDINDYVGEDNLNTFGKYVDDCIYIRNEKYSMDYEIIIDDREYSDVAPKGASTFYPEE